jgi:hypothetical protein
MRNTDPSRPMHSLASQLLEKSTEVRCPSNEDTHTSPDRPRLARGITLTPDCAPMLPHVILPRLQAVKLAIITKYYTPLQGQDTIVYGKIAVPVPAPPPSGAAINHLGLVGLRGKTRRSPAWLII